MEVLIRKFRRFLKFSAQEKRWLVIAIPSLGLARLAILILPFRVFFPVLGTHYKNVAVSLCLSEQQQLLAKRIGRIIQTAARCTPWQSKCLAQAMVAKLFLTYYKLPYLVYFGVNKKDNGELQAHAWVCTGRVHVTGGDGFTPFTIVSIFGSKDIDIIPKSNTTN